MSIRTSIVRATRPLLDPTPCLTCQFRMSLPARRYATARKAKYRITTAQQQMLSPEEQRSLVDKQQRVNWFKETAKTKLNHVPAGVSSQIVQDFLVAQKDNVDPAANIKAVAKRYGKTVGDVAHVAMTLLLIRNLNDSSGRLTQSENRTLAKDMLVACSAAGDLFATIQILNARYLDGLYDMEQARDLISKCSATDILQCEETLNRLAKAGDGFCLTMQGLFLEKAGQKDEAREKYREALKVYHFEFDERWPHSGALPWIPPWRALADSLLSDPAPTAEARKEAKAVLETGAVKGDDPIAYWQLAHFEAGRTPFWFKCMNKVAASGHSGAAYNLGRFHLDTLEDPTLISHDTGLKKFLHFVTSWKSGSVKRLAIEWLELAASGGHKPAMLDLAEVHNSDGNLELALKYLRRTIDPPPSGAAEEWPQLVKRAQLRLPNVEKRYLKTLKHADSLSAHA